MTVRLGADFETHHVHTMGYVFRVRMRGTGPVVGKEVLQKPYVVDESRLGYRPRYPEEEAARARIREATTDLVEEARRRHAETPSQRAAAS